MINKDSQWGVVTHIDGTEGEEDGDFHIGPDISHDNSTLTAQAKGALTAIGYGIKQGGLVSAGSGLSANITALDGIASSTTYGPVAIRTTTTINRASLPNNSTFTLFAAIDVTVGVNDTRESRLPAFLTDSALTLDGAVPLARITTAGGVVTVIVDIRPLLGAGGGHTILDPAASALTQRANLQFLGDDVAVTDDSGNNRTKVTILRKVAVYLGAVLKSTRGKLNLIAGDNITIDVTDNAGTGSADVTISATTAASIWRNGSGAPSNTLGANGDYYLDTVSGNVYKKAAGTYSLQGNIKGATGATGTTGTAGAVWRDGAGAPTDGVGANGDYYLDDTTGDVYTRAAGTYGSAVANITGPPNPYWPLALYAADTPTAGKPVFAMGAVIPFRLESGLPDLFTFTGTVPTADADFSITQNGTPVGVITLEAGTGAATVSFADDVDFALGDLLAIYPPSPADTTLADVAITIKAVTL